MPGRTIEQRIEANERRIEQLGAQNRDLKAKHSQQERKERTRRLIQMGGVLAALGLDLPAVQELQREANRRSEIRQYLDKLIARGRERQSQTEQQEQVSES